MISDEAKKAAKAVLRIRLPAKRVYKNLSESEDTESDADTQYTKRSKKKKTHSESDNTEIKTLSDPASDGDELPVVKQPKRGRGRPQGSGKAQSLSLSSALRLLPESGDEAILEGQRMGSHIRGYHSC